MRTPEAARGRPRPEVEEHRGTRRVALPSAFPFFADCPRTTRTTPSPRTATAPSPPSVTDRSQVEVGQIDVRCVRVCPDARHLPTGHTGHRPPYLSSGNCCPPVVIVIDTHPSSIICPRSTAGGISRPRRLQGSVWEASAPLREASGKRPSIPLWQGSVPLSCPSRPPSLARPLAVSGSKHTWSSTKAGAAGARESERVSERVGGAATLRSAQRRASPACRPTVALLHAAGALPRRDPPASSLRLASIRGSGVCCSRVLCSKGALLKAAGRGSS